MQHLKSEIQRWESKNACRSLRLRKMFNRMILEAGGTTFDGNIFALTETRPVRIPFQSDEDEEKLIVSIVFVRSPHLELEVGMSVRQGAAVGTIAIPTHGAVSSISIAVSSGTFDLTTNIVIEGLNGAETVSRANIKAIEPWQLQMQKSDDSTLVRKNLTVCHLDGLLSRPYAYVGDYVNVDGTTYEVLEGGVAKQRLAMQCHCPVLFDVVQKTKQAGPCWRWFYTSKVVSKGKCQIQLKTTQKPKSGKKKTADPAKRETILAATGLDDEYELEPYPQVEIPLCGTSVGGGINNLTAAYELGAYGFHGNNCAGFLRLVELGHGKFGYLTKHDKNNRNEMLTGTFYDSEKNLENNFSAIMSCQAIQREVNKTNGLQITFLQTQTYEWGGGILNTAYKNVYKHAKRGKTKKGKQMEFKQGRFRKDPMPAAESAPMGIALYAPANMHSI